MIKSIIPILLTFAVLLHLYYVTFINYTFQYNHLTISALTISLIWLVYLVRYVEKEYKFIFYFLIFLLILSFISHCILPLIELL